MNKPVHINNNTNKINYDIEMYIKPETIYVPLENKNGITYKMWLEDENSLEERLILMQDKKLAGAAFWSSELDNSEAWDIIIKYIN